MAILPIIVAPDSRLKLKSQPVRQVDAETRQLMDDMLATMYAAPGIGLAAPQVGVLKRVIVLDVAKDGEPKQPLAMADPEIVAAADEDMTYEEGCLSLPSHYSDVVRPAWVTVRYRDRDNTVRELKAEGLLSTCVQHEIDHLDGKLFIDYLGPLKRQMITRKMEKLKRERARE